MPRQRDDQLCSQCRYDITGLAPPGRLIRCPECGSDNRMGHIDIDAVRPAMPPWWHLGLSLGWPTVIWLYFAIAAWRIGDQPLIVAAVILGGLVLFVALARAAMIAFDCSTPYRRGRALTWAILWAVVGSVGVPAALILLVGSLAFLMRGLEAIRPG